MGDSCHPTVVALPSTSSSFQPSSPRAHAAMLLAAAAALVLRPADTVALCAALNVGDARCSAAEAVLYCSRHAARCCAVVLTSFLCCRFCTQPSCCVAVAGFAAVLGRNVDVSHSPILCVTLGVRELRAAGAGCWLKVAAGV